MPYIKVALDVPVPRLFDYQWAEACPSDVGRRVRVPFGRKHLVGVILAVDDAPAIDAAKVRTAEAILADTPPLPADLLALLRFCSRYYHHPIGEVVLAALPGRHRSSAAQRAPIGVSITSAGVAALREDGHRMPVGMAVLERLARAGTWDENAVRALPAAERGALRRLLTLGYAERTEHGTDTPSNGASIEPEQVLTLEQSQFIAAFSTARRGFRCWLLHGITGSGKTEAYLRIMAQVLDAERQVLLLVPEIGLTPQLEASLRARFSGWPLVTLHSGLPPSQRAARWLAAHAGEARIVVGTRSAVFAPLPHLGLIIVDEEHDASYKQGEGVRYSARDLAIWRAHQRDVPVVLGSATPALETYQRALGGRYALARLTQRPSAASLPVVKLVDAGSVPNRDGVAPVLIDAIKDRVGRGEQVLVFINRRGYAPVLLCAACGWAPECPRCSVHAVFHKSAAQLLCHHCGHRQRIPSHCGRCGNADLHPVGFGTQRIEATLRSAVPAARLLRVDRDTIRGRDTWPEMRTAIARREVDVLVGTQLLSKGHDFHGLSLVCVLNADRSLYSTNFRASEQLFAQLLQVSGRAGRGSVPGEVLIQTAFPAHPLYAAVRAHDYDAFAAALLEERKLAGLPPFMHQALLRAESNRQENVMQFLERAAALAAPFAGAVTLYDPAPAAMPRLQGRERAQLLVQSSSRASLHRFLDRWCEALWTVKASRARWVLDVDPLDI